MTNRSRVCCATITPFGKASVGKVADWERESRIPEAMGGFGGAGEPVRKWAGEKRDEQGAKYGR